jgi:hypothetical protein
MNEIMKDTVTLTVWSPDAPTRLDTVLSVPVANVYVGGRGNIRSTWKVPFAAGPKYAATTNRIFFTDGKTFSYHSVSHDGSLEMIVRVDEDARPITSRDIRVYREGTDARRLPPEDCPYPDIFPVIDDLMIDSEGNVWLRGYAVEPVDRRT